jgi:hypothetical protein
MDGMGRLAESEPQFPVVEGNPFSWPAQKYSQHLRTTKGPLLRILRKPIGESKWQSSGQRGHAGFVGHLNGRKENAFLEVGSPRIWRLPSPFH